MSEFQPGNEPDKEIPRVRLETSDGSKYEATPQNTAIFKHADEPQYDMLFVHGESDGTATEGVCFWRERITDFDAIAEWMIDHEFPYMEADVASETVRKAYHEYKQDRAEATVADCDPDKHLTPRQNRRVAFLGYLLEHGLLDPKDFGSENGSTV